MPWKNVEPNLSQMSKPMHKKITAMPKCAEDSIMNKYRKTRCAGYVCEPPRIGARGISELCHANCGNELIRRTEKKKTVKKCSGKKNVLRE